jgi:hypothetical protein
MRDKTTRAKKMRHGVEKMVVGKPGHSNRASSCLEIGKIELGKDG